MNNDWVNDYLMHHGILGQKWGVRRFQNPDGSLTDAGRKREQRISKWRAKKSAKINRGYDKEDAREEKHYNKKIEKLSRNPKNKYRMEEASIKYNTRKKIRDELRKIENKNLSKMTPGEYNGLSAAAWAITVANSIAFGPMGIWMSSDSGLLGRPSEASVGQQRKIKSDYGLEEKGQLAELKYKQKEERAELKYKQKEEKENRKRH